MSGNLTILEDVLNDPRVLRQFTRYLESIFCEETLDYLWEYEIWKNGDYQMEKAIHIYDTYVRSGSYKELNLPNNVKTLAKEVFSPILEDQHFDVSDVDSIFEKISNSVKYVF